MTLRRTLVGVLDEEHCTCQIRNAPRATLADVVVPVRALKDSNEKANREPDRR
jgi:hypothetical protein